MELFFLFFISSFIDIYTCYSFKKMLTFLSKLVSRYHKGSIFHTNYFCSTHPHPKKQKQSRGKFLFKLKIKENFNKLKWCFFYLLVSVLSNESTLFYEDGIHKYSNKKR